MSYRLACQLQIGPKNLATSKGEFNQPPTNGQAVNVCKGLIAEGKKEFPKDNGQAFETAVEKMIKWVESFKDNGYQPKGNGDEHRQEFNYKNDSYRVDIKVGGKTAEGKWFLK
ncbi:MULTISPECIES: hypothetical protein [Spirulina sp. CCY15215]|uniref:hypothetical protein n=1 Tax=Spirulina sp. CCY15215 TaxID=2767591 RepID=UPI0019504764|nr:hypothetical protein [Spirulina major]